jgi:hypothetical protein
MTLDWAAAVDRTVGAAAPAEEPAPAHQPDPAPAPRLTWTERVTAATRACLDRAGFT